MAELAASASIAFGEQGWSHRRAGMTLLAGLSDSWMNLYFAEMVIVRFASSFP